MNSSRRPTLPCIPALDGLRAVAVVAVLLYHADVSWMEGGHLGVTVFFTLSGFLITALLLVEHERTGTIDLRAFWARRARRLVPAMFVCFGLIAAVLSLADRRPRAGVIGDAVASAGWVANWRFVFDRRTYGDLFSMPSPFQHFWSLAIEEQFYVVFPIVVLGLLTVVGRRRFRRLPLAGLLVAVAAASTVAAAALHDTDGAVARAYYGTDARIAEPVVGALLALVLVRGGRLHVLGRRRRRAIKAASVPAAVAIVGAFVALGDRDDALYNGGFLATALATAVVIAASVQPASLFGALLRWPPLVALGRVSYGVYLFHWPVFLLLTERSTGLHPSPLLAARATVTLALAALSYRLVEAPVRFGRLPRRVALLAWPNAAVAGVAVVALASGQLVPTPSTATSVAAGAAAATSTTTAGSHVADAPTTSISAKPAAPSAAGSTAAPAKAATAPPSPRQGELPRGGPREPAPRQLLEDPDKATVPPPPPTPPGTLRVAVIGDSVGDNLATGLSTWAEERGDVTVHNLSISGCPLSRGGMRRYGEDDPVPVADACKWWDDPASERRRALESFEPDVVVVEDGVNELFDRKVSPWREFRRPGDPTFDRWLRGEYEVAFERWRAGGAAVVLVNTPCGDWGRYEWFSQSDADLRTRALNLNVYTPFVDVTSADLYERVCPQGRYRDEVEGLKGGRPDGLHFSDAASAALARNWLGPILLDAAGVQEDASPADNEGG